MIREVAKLSLDAVVTRRPEPLTAAVDEDLVMLDPSRSLYFGLNSVGHRIWELLERPQPVNALCAALESQFDVSAQTCRIDVLAFLERLADAELVEIS
jgi:hypothetical protein